MVDSGFFAQFQHIQRKYNRNTVGYGNMMNYSHFRRYITHYVESPLYAW